MKKNLLLTCLLLVVFLATTKAQYYNETPEFLKANSVWAMADSSGLNFNSSPPSTFQSGMNMRNPGLIEGNASVADPLTGALLFYSDGTKVWDASHTVMPNGDSLWGQGTPWPPHFPNRIVASVVQGVCIVPVLDTAVRGELESYQKYYLFSLNGKSNNFDFRDTTLPSGAGCLFYSIVDMSLNNGLGDIIPTKKNMVLSSDTLSESMIAIPGDNCDIWLLVYDYINLEIKAYNISKYGINPTPVISPLPESDYEIGGLAVSPDRSMIAISGAYGTRFRENVGLTVAKFNAATGEVSNPIKISDIYQVYTSCFSPDNSKLYCGGVFQNYDFSNPNPPPPNPASGYNIAQFDLSNYDSLAIATSEIGVNYKWRYGCGVNQALKLYNQKIYVNTTKFIPQGGIAIIKDPNLSGVACNFDTTDVIDARPYSVGQMRNLPNEVVFPVPPPSPMVYNLALDTTVCPGEQVAVSLDPNYDTYLWNDGFTDTRRIIDAPGVYYVEQFNGCRTYIDTFKLNFFDFPEPVITVDVFDLSTAQPYDTYQWLFEGQAIPGATDSIYTVPENGNYQVIVTKGGCTDTSEVYEVTNTGITTKAALAAQIEVYPNPSDYIIHIRAPFPVNVRLIDVAGKVIRQSEEATYMNVDDLATGVYLLQLRDKNGVLLKVEKLLKSN